MKKFNKFVALRVITFMAIVMLPFLGSDCQDVINQINNPPTGNLQGNWTLIYNAGTLLDICPGEQVTFPNNTGGTATLTCPNQTPIDRSYSVSGSTLTYTASGIEYTVSFTQNNELVLTGVNNNRILYYSSSITDKKDVQSKEKNSINYNSSEITK